MTRWRLSWIRLAQNWRRASWAATSSGISGWKPDAGGTDGIGVADAHPAEGGYLAHAPGTVGTGAWPDARAGTRRPRFAREHECRLRHRRHLAAGRLGPGQLRAACRGRHP